MVRITATNTSTFYSSVPSRTDATHRPVYSFQPGGGLNIKQLKSNMSKNMVASIYRTSPAMQYVLAFYGKASA
ncbi:hypothetical protein FDX04_06715 [Citrobacter sp. wls615]|nr:hypothetical protein FDX04_06715 [Citrobacter sp. wls615]